MKKEISHSFAEESMEAKIRWFLQKPMSQRLLEAFQEARLIQKIYRIEIPDDRSSFKSFKVLKRK